MDNFKTVYWKVHISNFDSFISYILERYKNFNNINDLKYFKDYFNHGTFIYLFIDIEDNGLYTLAYTNYRDKKWADTQEWKYMGEFYGRRDKLKRLEIISRL